MYHHPVSKDPSLVDVDHDEAGRLAALRELEVLDTGPEAAFDNVVDLVRTVLGVPVATISLIDQDRQWFKAAAGIDLAESARDVSFCTHTIAGHSPLVVPDATVDPRFADNPFVTAEGGVRAYAGIPLETSEGYNVGSLCAIDRAPRQFTQHDLDILANFARIVVNELELRRIAARDQLTGALTRRGVLDKARFEIARFSRYGRSACLVMIDIDHFKAINDQYGHKSGDEVLRSVAAVVRDQLRPTDLLGRVGGEEFVVILPETRIAEARMVAERLRTAIASHPVELDEAGTLAVTASFGIAALEPSMATPEAWMEAADVPLYEAKRQGRNRVIGRDAEAA